MNHHRSYLHLVPGQILGHYSDYLVFRIVSHTLSCHSNWITFILTCFDFGLSSLAMRFLHRLFPHTDDRWPTIGIALGRGWMVRRQHETFARIYSYWIIFLFSLLFFIYGTFVSTHIISLTMNKSNWCDRLVPTGHFSVTIGRICSWSATMYR